MTTVKTWLGYPYPLGATWLGNGVNFALFSESAASVDLCLFGQVDARQEKIRIPMKNDFESLNVSVATGVILYEVMKQRVR